MVSGTGSTFASYILGQVTSATQLVQEGSAFRRILYSGYIQDDWRIAPRLTINAGLRYDLQTQAVEKQNGIENFDITKPNPTSSRFTGLVEYANTNGYGRNFVNESVICFDSELEFSDIEFDDDPGNRAFSGLAKASDEWQGGPSPGLRDVPALALRITGLRLVSTQSASFEWRPSESRAVPGRE